MKIDSSMSHNGPKAAFGHRVMWVQLMPSRPKHPAMVISGTRLTGWCIRTEMSALDGQETGASNATETLAVTE